MGKYLKRIGTFFTMLLMLIALWSMTAMAATDTDRNAFYVQGSGRLGKPLRMGMGQ